MRGLGYNLRVHPSVVLVTPALADANNGNWQTAQRWARMLRGHYAVRLTDRWDGGEEDLMLALHARRSAGSIAAWRARHPGRALVVVLTGTDLYRDIDTDPQAQRSLQLADRLVVLQALGVERLPAALRARTVVCVQSATQRRTLDKTTRHLRAVMVGHLREEKCPQTYMEAAALLVDRTDILLDHIGSAIDPELGGQARAMQARQPRYRWLGALPREAVRRHIQRAHVLVHASRMEGGAHVVIEAITSGTPVLASRIDGNLGLLGADHPACFEVGDAQGLAQGLRRLRDDAAMLKDLQARCLVRAPMFLPSRERQTLLALLDNLLRGRAARPVGDPT